MSKGKIIVISGASGVGKSTVLKEVMKARQDLVFSVSATTRAPRPDEVDGVKVYDNMPVWVVFDDNGTYDNLYDDNVLGMVFDRETAIYDELYEAMSEEEDWEVTRDGNNIHIGMNEE